MTASDQPQDNSKDVVQLLQQINSGLLDARVLDKQSRQGCVEALKLEGYTINLENVEALKAYRESKKEYMEKLAESFRSTLGGRSRDVWS